MIIIVLIKMMNSNIIRTVMIVIVIVIVIPIVGIVFVCNELVFILIVIYVVSFFTLFLGIIFLLIFDSLLLFCCSILCSFKLLFEYNELTVFGIISNLLHCYCSYCIIFFTFCTTIYIYIYIYILLECVEYHLNRYLYNDNLPIFLQRILKFAVLYLIDIVIIDGCVFFP